MNEHRIMLNGLPTCVRCDPPVAFAGQSLEQAEASMQRHDEVVHDPGREASIAAARASRAKREQE